MAQEPITIKILICKHLIKKQKIEKVNFGVGKQQQKKEKKEKVFFYFSESLLFDSYTRSLVINGT